QHREEYDRSYKVLKWVDVTSAEINFFFFLAIIFIIGHTRRDNLKEYWSTGPFLEIPIFGKLMSCKRFEQIWWCLHFSINELQPQSTSRLFKIQPLLNFFVRNFRSFEPKQQLSLDESVIPWRGRLHMKYGLLVHIVTESTSGYIGNLEIYSGEGKKLQETIVSVLEPYLDQNYHVYQDNYYNSVVTAEYFLLRKVYVCGTIRVSRGLPLDLKEESKSLKRGETTFRRKGDILVKKPICISEYNMFMKRVDRANQYLAYYSLPRKTVKWTKKVALWLINCAIFNSFLVYTNLNPDSKLKYKAFLMNVSKTWATDRMVVAEPESDTDLVRPGPSTPTPHRPHVDHLVKIVKSELSKGEHPSRQVLCNATSQRGMFPEISHSQALLGALVNVLQKFLFIKLNRFYINF
ncbi:hypothetical protein B7P43_G16151, partial [Cryptotermes secundus]